MTVTRPFPLQIFNIRYRSQCQLFMLFQAAVHQKKCQKKLENIAEKFGSTEKSRTFALTFEKRGSRKRRNSATSSLKRLIYCTRSKYRENTIYREALISL